jgi:hypothetical protein
MCVTGAYFSVREYQAAASLASRYSIIGYELRPCTHVFCRHVASEDGTLFRLRHPLVESTLARMLGVTLVYKVECDTLPRSDGLEAPELLGYLAELGTASRRAVHQLRAAGNSLTIPSEPIEWASHSKHSLALVRSL